MGACSSADSDKPLPEVFIPYPTTLEEFETFGAANISKSLTVLGIKAAKDATRPEPDQLEGFYQVHFTIPQPDILITHPATEAQSVIAEFKGQEVPTGDAGKTHHELVEGGSDLITKGRLYCALLRSRKIVVAAKLRYTGPVDIVRINTLLQIPLPRSHSRRLIDFFNELDASGNGLICANEFATCFERSVPAISQSVFFRFIFKLCLCRSDDGACAEEFFAIVCNLCTMNEEEMTRHAFDCLAEDVDAFKDRYCDISKLQSRFPILKASQASRNLENKSFMKEVEALVEFRRRTWEEAYFDKHGMRLRFGDFIDIKRKSLHVLHSLAYCRTWLRKKLFGDAFWRAREQNLRAQEKHRMLDPERKSSSALRFFVELKQTTGVTSLPFQMVPLSVKEAEAIQTAARAPPASIQPQSRRASLPGVTARGPKRPSVASDSRRASVKEVPTRPLTGQSLAASLGASVGLSLRAHAMGCPAQVFKVGGQ